MSIIYEPCNLEWVILPATLVLLWQTRNKFVNKLQISLPNKLLQTSWLKIIQTPQFWSLDGLYLIKDKIKVLTVLQSSVQFLEKILLSKCIWAIGKIQLLTVVGQRSMFACWLSASRGCSHPCPNFLRKCLW